MLLKWLAILCLAQLKHTYAACGTWIPYATHHLCVAPTPYSNSNFSAAQAYCQSLGTGSNLATIYNYQEYSEIFIDVMSSCASGTFWMLGYTDAATEGKWLSMANNDRACFERWYTGEPNNNQDEDCMAFTCPWIPKGTTGDIPCYWPSVDSNVICQKRITTPTFSNVTCPTGWTAVGRFCYKHITNAATFTDAQGLCPCGSTLPIFQCAFEYDDFISSAYWQTTLVSSSGMWLNMLPVSGVANPASFLDYEWQSNPTEKLIYSRWQTTRPDPRVRIKRAANPTANMWDTEPITNQHPVVCQLSPSAPSVCEIQNTTMTISGSFANNLTWSAFGCNNVTYTCNANAYMLSDMSTTRTFICQANRTWDKVVEPCLTMCPAISVNSSLSISNPGNSTIGNKYWPSTTVYFSCTNASYYIINPLAGNATTCLSHGTWTTEPSNIGCLSTCDIPPTPYPLNYSMPALESNGRIAPGRTITSQYCTNTVNYYLPGTVTATCLSNGTWNTPLPPCIPRCQAISAADLTARNLAATYSDTINYRLNSNVSFACSDPSLYALIGSTVAFCNSSFLWNNTIPICQPTCPVLVLTQPLICATNGTGPAGRFIGPTTVTFSCNASNYALVGEDLLTCTTNGSWSNQLPTCIATCPPMQVKSGVEINYADNKRRIDSTAQFSCKEGSELKGAKTAICGMDQSWKLSPDAQPSCDERKESQAITTAKIVIQTLGCSFLIGAASVAIGVMLILRDFSIECLLHMSQDLAIILGHVLILTLRDRTNPWELCTAVATLLQFAFVALFIFLTIEAVHSYTILSNVLNNGSLVPRKIMIGIGWTIPTVYTAATAGVFYEDYALSYACWLNWGNTTVASLTMGPVILCTILTVISTEAGGSYRRKALPLMNKHQLFAARVNQNGMWFLVSGHWVSWFLGSYAIYSVNIGWIAPVFVANVVLGVMIFVFHVMGSPEANKVVRGLIQRCCNKKTA